MATFQIVEIEAIETEVCDTFAADTLADTFAADTLADTLADTF